MGESAPSQTNWPALPIPPTGTQNHVWQMLLSQWTSSMGKDCPGHHWWGCEKLSPGAAWAAPVANAATATPPDSSAAARVRFELCVMFMALTLSSATE